MECRKTLEEERMNAMFAIYGACNKTPPPIGGAASAFYPHNFSHQKYSKKSACHWVKKFRKKFVGKCFGRKGKPPILMKGGEVLKYERLIYVYKDSGIIGDCKRIAVL